MAFTWERVNPDAAMDELPFPYRILDEVVQEIIEAVGDQVDVIEKRKRSEACEFSLPEAKPTSFVQVAGHITCAYTEPRGTSRMAVGTSHGEALLVDARRCEVVAHAHPFSESEPVTCVSIVSESAYQDVFAGPGVDPPVLPSPHLKLFAAGLTTPKILVYDIHKETYGVMLKPACAIHLPQPEEDGEDGKAVIEQLHTRGCAGGIWACALLPDGTVRVYLTPLGEPVIETDEVNVVLDAPIQEGDEDEDEEAGADAPGPGEEFNLVPQVNTATYSFSLTQLAPTKSLPMPELDTITLHVFSPRPAEGAFGTGVSAGQVPTLCFSSSSESNVVLAHFIPSPSPIVAPSGLDMDGLLNQAVPPPGLLNDPESTKRLQHRRRWALPAKSSAVAVSPNGGIVAIGGSQGSLALVNAATGPNLRTMLPGHYGAINALAFFRDKTLVSAGADCWVHQYCMQTDTILARHLASPPPSPATVLGAACSQSMPLAVSMDAEGSLRLWDLKRGCKVAQMACVSPPPEPPKEGAEEEETEKKVIVLKEDETPKLLLHNASGFCVICMSVRQPEQLEPGEETEEPPPDGPIDDGDDAGYEPDGDAPPAEEERSWLVFFDNAQLLKKLFPTLAAKAGDKGDITRLYENLSKEDLAKLQPQGVPSTLDRATKLSHKKPPPDPAAVRAAKEQAERAKMNTKKSRSGKLDSNIMISKLTAENLRKFAAAQAAEKEAAGGAKKASSFGSMAFARSATNSADKNKAEEVTPHGVPKNWQVNVRKQLKKGLSGKDTRLVKIQKRLDQLKKEIGGD